MQTRDLMLFLAFADEDCGRCARAYWSPRKANGPYPPERVSHLYICESEVTTFEAHNSHSRTHPPTLDSTLDVQDHCRCRLRAGQAL